MADITLYLQALGFAVLELKIPSDTSTAYRHWVSSSSSNHHEYMRSSGPTLLDAHSPQREPHLQLTPSLSFPCRQSLECA